MPTEAPTPIDYFAFGESVHHILDDGVSYVSIKVMNEGDRRRWQSKTSRPVDIDQNSQKLSIHLQPVEDMHAMIETAVDGWNLTRGGDPVPFSATNLKLFLDNANPAVVDNIAEAVRKANPWMLTEAVTVEEIDEEIDRLQERRRLVLEREAGN